MGTIKGVTKVYVETKDGIKDPFTLGERQSYREIFEADITAEALWILRPGAREPFRVAWRSIFQRPAKGAERRPTKDRKPREAQREGG